jgi:hypothetical protein
MNTPRPSRTAPPPPDDDFTAVETMRQTPEQAVRTNHVPAVSQQNGASHPMSERVEQEGPTLPVTPFANLAGAIASVMAEIKPVEKEGWNDFHKYNYAKMQDLSRELTPLMGKHGVVIFQTEEGREMFDEGRAVAVRYRFTIVHKSGEIWPERPIQTGLSMCRTSQGKFDDKTLNKCHTSARKYFLLSLFQIPTSDDDDDADGGEHDKPTRPQGRRRQVPAPNGKLSPHLVAINDGETPEEWQKRFVPFIQKAESESEIDRWYELNELIFEKLKKRFPAVHDSIVDAMDARAEELSKPATVRRPVAPPPDDGGIPAQFDRREKRVADEIGDKDRDWLASLDNDFADCSTIEELVEQQARLMTPHKTTTAGAVWNLAADILGKHIERINERHHG